MTYLPKRLLRRTFVTLMVSSSPSVLLSTTSVFTLGVFFLDLFLFWEYSLWGVASRVIVDAESARVFLVISKDSNVPKLEEGAIHILEYSKKLGIRDAVEKKKEVKDTDLLLFLVFGVPFLLFGDLFSVSLFRDSSSAYSPSDL